MRRYPKLRDGPSPVGEGQIRQIQDSMGDMPFAKKLGRGSRSYKRGEFYEVFKDGAGGAYFIVGDDGGLTYYVHGSEDARKKFVDRKVSSPEIGLGTSSVVDLLYVGNGRVTIGGIITAAPGEYYGYILLGRDALVFQDSGVSFPVAADGYGLRAGYTYTQTPGGSYGSPKTRHYGAAFLAPVVDAPAIPYFAVSKNGTWSTAPLPYWANSTSSKPSVQQLGPGDLLALVATYIYDDVPDGPNVPPEFSISTDAGSTWDELPSADMFDAVMDLYQDALDIVAEAARNAALLVWRHGVGTMVDYVYGAPLSPTVFVGVMPVMDDLNWEDETFPGGATGLAWRSFVATPSGVSFTATLPFRLNPYGPTPADYKRVIQAYHYEHAVYLQVTAAGGHELWKTEDGTVWVQTATLPFPRESTGAITFGARGAMLLPAYAEDAYRVYESKDAGETWAKRAVINSTFPAPTSGWTALGRFTNLSFVTDADRPADLIPQAPWIANSAREYTAP